MPSSFLRIAKRTASNSRIVRLTSVNGFGEKAGGRTGKDRTLTRTTCKKGSVTMGLNSLTCPALYEDLRSKTDREITLDIDGIDEAVNPPSGFEGIIGRSSGLRHVLQMVETVACGDSTVLLLGETGTGKELVARAIHRHSPRRDRPFVKLNCAAIPTGLLESELFGHERGSFTGAIAQQIGRLELADQGSLFLDEVRDIPFEIQPKLLRALREREFERLGSNRTKKVAFPRTGEIAISVNFTKSTGSFPPFFFCLFNFLRMVC